VLTPYNSWHPRRRDEDGRYSGNIRRFFAGESFIDRVPLG
jgi:hypothetical protein